MLGGIIEKGRGAGTWSPAKSVLGLTLWACPQGRGRPNLGDFLLIVIQPLATPKGRACCASAHPKMKHPIVNYGPHCPFPSIGLGLPGKKYPDLGHRVLAILNCAHGGIHFLPCKSPQMIMKLPDVSGSLSPEPGHILSPVTQDSAQPGWQDSWAGKEEFQVGESKKFGIYP